MAEVNFPPGEVTPMGARLLLEAVEPMWEYESWNGVVKFDLTGAFAPVPGVQSGVISDDLKNLLPTWTMQDQQGANEDGVTYNGSVLNPIEFDFEAVAHGNTPAECAHVVRTWIDSWSDERPGKLSVLTPDAGYWWALARWLKTPTNALRPVRSCRQEFNWTPRIDAGCWRTFDSVSMFAPDFRSVVDEFGTDYPDSWGPSWSLNFMDTGGGNPYTSGGEARWSDDPDDPLFTESRRVVGRRNDYLSATDNPVVEIELGSTSETTFGTAAQNEIWARMANTGTVGDTGICARIQRHLVVIEAVVGGVVREIGRRALMFPPTRGDRFTLVCGYEGDPRRFRLMKGRFPLIDEKERGTFSALGAGFRRAGMGMRAGNAVITQATPARVRDWSAGDNTSVAQNGVLTLTNCGDQDEFYRFTVFGPFDKMSFSNGTDTSKWIEFGPLGDGQVAQIRTARRLRGVVDFSDVQPTNAQMAQLQKSIAELSILAANGDVRPLLAQFESAFGMIPPQGELYRLLKGRWTNPIPRQEPGMPAVESRILVKVEGGNANTKVIGALTPRRRWPL